MKELRIVALIMVLAHFSKSNSRTFVNHPRHIQGDYINPKRHLYKHS